MTPQIEYGAQLVSVAANVYVHDFVQQVVTDWITSMENVTPLRLVMRVWDGETCGNWIVIEGAGNDQAA